MGIISYTLMAYGLTAVISFAVIAIVVVIGKIMSRGASGEEGTEDA